MMKFFILVFLINFSYSKIQCNTKFMSSYGFQGHILPQKRRTLFCQNVQMKCCSLLDELKFMKFWRTHYQDKLQKTFDLFQLKFIELSKTMQKLHKIDFKDLEKHIDEEKKEQGLELWNQIRKFDPEIFKKISTELDAIRDYENEQKKQFVCYLCDVNTHINISNIDSKLYMEQKFCESFVINYQSFLKAKIIHLDAILTKIFQIIDMTNIEIEGFKLTELELKELVGVTEQSLKCLNSGYSLDNCRSLCARYSIANLSPTVFANLPLQTMLEKKQTKKAEFEKLEKEKKAVKDIKCAEDDEECKEKKKQAEEKLEKDKNAQEKPAEGQQKTENIEQEKKRRIRRLNVQLSDGRVLQSHTRKLQYKKDSFFLNQYKKHKKRYHNYRKRRIQNFIQQRKMQQQWSYIPVPIPQTQNYQAQQQQDYEEKEYLKERIRRIKRKLEKAEKQKEEEAKKKEEEEKKKKEEKFDMKNFEELQKKQKEILKEEFRKKLFNDQKISVYKKYYEGLQKGDSKQFENLYTLTNHFFDGDFLDDYQLGFAFTGGVTSHQEQSKEFIASEEKLFDSVVKIWSETKPSFQFQSSAKCTFDVVDYLNQYVETDVIEFNMNIKMIFGSIKKGDPVNYDDVKKDLMEKLIPRVEEYEKEFKKKLEKIKKKGSAKGKQGGGEKGAEQKPAEGEEKPAEGEQKPEEQAKEERRLLKAKIKNLKKRLKGIKNYFKDN